MCDLYAVAHVGMSVVGTILISPADNLKRQAACCIRSMLAPLKCVQNDMSDFIGVCSRFWTAINRHATVFIHSFTLKSEDIIGKSSLLICLNRNMLLYSHREGQCCTAIVKVNVNVSSCQQAGNAWRQVTAV